MAIFNAKKNIPTLLLLAIMASILLLTVLLNNNNSDKTIIAINSDSNTFLSPLENHLVKQIKQTEKEDSVFVYSVFFKEDPIERSLILINKNPTKREFLNQVQVHVFPTNVSDYKKLPNYKNGYLDYSVKRKPVMRNHEDNNYSVLKITLPQINIDRIYLYQPGIYKKTIENTFFQPIEGVSSDFPAEAKHLYFPVFHRLLNDFQIDYLPYKSDTSDKFYSIDNFAKETSNTIVKVNQSQKFWRFLSLKDPQYASYISITGSQKDTVSNLLKSFLDNNNDFNSIFNVTELANYYALINLFTDNSEREIGFVYNPSENKLEPFYINSSNVGAINNYVQNENIPDTDFLLSYTAALNTIGSLALIDILNSIPHLSERILKINSKNPSLLFETSILKHNQLVLLKGARPSTAIKAELLDVNKNEINVLITNISNYPITIKNLSYQTKKHIVAPLKNSKVAPNTSDSVSFELPRSFENLFVHKKSKTTGFIFEKDVFDLHVGYSVGNINKTHYTELIPYQPLENYLQKEDLFRSNFELTGLDYLNIDNSAKTIEIVKDFELDKPLIFPEGYTIIAKPGRHINIIEGGKIISYSPFQFIGTKEKRINITSSDKEGQGLLIIANGKESTIKYLNFDGLTNPSHGMWSTTSAVTFYESPVNFDYVKISNNTCEDAINVVRTYFKMTNTTFKNTQSDAFDGDFVTGTINSCVFQDLGNDAIDVSGSNLDISNVKIINAGDKGLSAGEDSQMKAQSVIIDRCEIAVAGKDLSIVSLKNLTIKNTKLGLTAFQKKPEFGPSNITATGIVMTDVETKYLIEDTSSLLVDGEKIETEQNVKDRMYGVEFGRSSSETRERQKEQ